MIDRKNYEIWMIDYTDGKLSPEQVAELLLFLEENPDLKKEWENFSNVVIPVSHEIFRDKNQLKKNAVNLSNFEEYAIGYIENKLTDEEKEAYLEFLEINPSFKKEHDLFALTRLNADAQVVFSEKHLLKQNSGSVLKLRVWWYAAAACLLAVMLFYFNRKPDVQVAELPSNNSIESVEKTQKDKQPENVLHRAIKRNEARVVAVNKITKTVRPKHTTIVTHTSSLVNDREPLPLISELEMLQAKVATPETEFKLQPLYAVAEGYGTVAQSEKSEKLPDILKEMAVKKLNTLAMNDDVDISENSKRVKVLAIFGAVVRKVTFQKVNIETTYSDEGKLSAYQITAGKFNFEKQILK